MPIPCRLNPLGISVREELPLTFTAVEASTVKLTATGSPTVAGLHYRLGTSGPWFSYTIGDTISLAAGEKVQFWNKAETLSLSGEDYVQFSMTGHVEATGSLSSMLNFLRETANFCFWRLFYNNQVLTAVPDITFSRIAYYAFRSTFEGTGIISGPSINCPVLESSSFYQAFRMCTHMINPPKILATVLRSGALNSALAHCYSLKELSDFYPTELYGTSLYNFLYNCKNINLINVNFTTWGTAQQTTDWVVGVPSSGTFIKPAALPEEYGPNRIPTGWTVVNK